MKLLAALAGAAIALGASAMADDGAEAVFGRWRIVRGVTAPWATDAETFDAPGFLGSTVTFSATRIKGPNPIGCAHVKYEASEGGPDWLFQGSLPEPQSEAARSLGLEGDEIKGVTVKCDAGLFEYHYADEVTLLLGLDNRVWTLSRAYGALAPKNSAEAAVERFIESHFAGDMGFDKARVAAKRAYLSKALLNKIDAYFGVPRPDDEVPPIDGDPFTDSQDYPPRFAVGADDKNKRGMAVPVYYPFGDEFRTVTFQMKREHARWVIDDLAFEDGSTLTKLLSGEA